MKRLIATLLAGLALASPAHAFDFDQSFNITLDCEEIFVNPPKGVYVTLQDVPEIFSTYDAAVKKARESDHVDNKDAIAIETRYGIFEYNHSIINIAKGVVELDAAVVPLGPYVSEVTATTIHFRDSQEPDGEIDRITGYGISVGRSSHQYYLLKCNKAPDPKF
jgi:hypothetical protein